MRPLAKTTARLWRAVAEIGHPVTIAEMRRRPQVVLAEKAAHRKLREVVTNLVQVGYLASDGGGRNKTRYWFGQNCKCPVGESRPTPWMPMVDSSRATERVLPMDGTYETKPIPMRPGSDDWRRHPSRVGDHLHHRDGRVTRLNADNTETLVKDDFSDDDIGC